MANLVDKKTYEEWKKKHAEYCDEWERAGFIKKFFMAVFDSRLMTILKGLDESWREMVEAGNARRRERSETRSSS